MSRKLLFQAALPLALVCGPLFGQDVMELHGYMRSGVGMSSNGGEQVSFFMANTGESPTGGPGYRLGNETDNYLELAFDIRAYEKDGTAFKLHFRPSFRQYYTTRDASADAGGNVDGSMQPSPNSQVWVREAWGEGTGVFGKTGMFKDSTVWIGRRFYERQDLHIRDEWYWNNSGDGAGIEHIDLGGAKLAYAYIQHDVGNLSTYWAPNMISWNGNTPTASSTWVSTGASNYNSTNGHSTIVGSHDIRVSDIKLWEGGSLILGVQYNNVSSGTGVLTINGMSLKDYRNKGVQWTAEINQANVMGGDNRFFATWGNGNTFWNWYNPEVTTHNTWYQVMDVAYLKLAKDLELQATAIWRKQEGADSNKGNSNVFESVGVRPVYFLTKHVSVAAEVGYDHMKFDNEADSRHLMKETLALQLSPQASFWSRPSLRFFVTKAQWDKQANAWNAIGSGQFGQATQGMTYGAQIEAWW